jgi:hypothetical protein
MFLQWQSLLWFVKLQAMFLGPWGHLARVKIEVSLQPRNFLR